MMNLKVNDRSYMSLPEIELLVKYARIAPGNIVELGTYCGGTAQILNNNIPDEKTIWTVDIYLNIHTISPQNLFREITYSARKDEKEVRLFQIFADSRPLGKHWGKDIGLLFVDSNPNYDFMVEEMSGWLQWVKPDGYIAIHDAEIGTGSPLCNAADGPQRGHPDRIRFVKELADGRFSPTLGLHEREIVYERIEYANSLVIFKKRLV